MSQKYSSRVQRAPGTSEINFTREAVKILRWLQSDVLEAMEGYFDPIRRLVPANRGLFLLLLLFILLIGILSMVLLLNIARGERKKTVLIVGPCGAGKTTLFYAIQEGPSPEGTVASMEENVAEKAKLVTVDKSSGTLDIIDIPGHPSLRSRLCVHAPKAAAVIFLVDSVDFLPAVHDAAEMLYDLLADSGLPSRTPVIIGCNKMDAGEHAHSEAFIKKQLAKELDAVRSTRASTLAADRSKVKLLGDPNKPFAFDQLAMPIVTLALSASTGDVALVARFIKNSLRL